MKSKWLEMKRVEVGLTGARILQRGILSGGTWMVVAAFAVCLTAATAGAELVRYYGLNETVNPSAGTTAVDATGNENGVYQGTAGPVVGTSSVNANLYGTAAEFSSSGGDNVNIGTGLNSLNSGFTVAAWIKPNSEAAGNWHTLIGNGTGDGWIVQFKKHSGNWEEIVFTIPGVMSYFTNSAFIESEDYGKWLHVAVSLDSANTLTIYRNGEQYGVVSNIISPSAGQGDYLIGANLWGEHLGGGIDELRVYNNVLSAGEIAQLANVPEPATMGLLAVGGLGVLFRRKR